MKKSFLLSVLFFITVNLYSQTWTEQTSGITTALYCVSAVNDNIAWAGGESGKVLRTTNKGVNWLNVSGNLPSNYSMYSIFAWDENLALVTGNSIGLGGPVAIYRTSNGGANWITAASRTGMCYAIWMTSATNAYYIGYPVSGYWDLLSSTNSGLNWSTWSLISTPSNSESVHNCAWFQGQQVWFGAYSRIYYSSNMGVNWSTQTIPPIFTGAICFNTATKGMAGGVAGFSELLFTNNAGTSWTSATYPFPASGTAGICGTESTWWVSQGGFTNSRIVYVSTNDGANWTTSYTAPDGINNHMTKSRSGFTIWLVRSNGGISRYGTPIVNIYQNSKKIPSSYLLNQNYPNPFNPETKIEFQIPEKNFVSIKIFDCLGKEISTLVSEFLQPGSYSTDFNASGLPGGVYFLKMISGGFSETKKMILVK